jgi:alpha-tubulin suppressor-like RCC1 family protein
MAFAAIGASGAATCGTPMGAASVCWGLNLAGKLGVGTRIELSTAPLTIAGGPRFVSFAGGQDYVCALDAAGSAFCWGGGRMGQLGSGEMLP